GTQRTWSRAENTFSCASAREVSSRCPFPMRSVRSSPTFRNPGPRRSDTLSAVFFATRNRGGRHEFETALSFSPRNPLGSLSSGRYRRRVRRRASTLDLPGHPLRKSREDTAAPLPRRHAARLDRAGLQERVASLGTHRRQT